MSKELMRILTYDVFNVDEVLAPSGAKTSKAFDLREVAQNGLFSLQYTVVGAGVVTFSYTMCSTEDGTFFTPVGGGTIKAGVVEGTGGLEFEPELFPFIKFVATETGGAAQATVSAKFNVQ